MTQPKITAPADLGPETILEIAAGQPVRVAATLLDAVGRHCAAAREVLGRGDPVYGVNTGMGALSGVSGVSAQLCQRLADFLNAGVVPAVPRTGMGCAGEIMPLAHAFGPLVGIGRVLAPGGGPASAGDVTAASDRGPAPAGGMTVPAAGALRASGLGDFSLGPKEGIALLAGVPGATALGLRRLAEARALESAMETAAALSIAAAG